MCESKTTLCLSHIAPSWSYKWAKQEGGVLGDYKSLNVLTKGQDGTKQYMLCAKCEVFLSKGEAYCQLLASEDIRRLTAFGTIISKDKPEIITGAKSNLIKQFICGIMLKSHFCRLAPFHNIQLPELQIDLIRDYLLGRTADYPFPIIARRIYPSPFFPGANPKSMMYPKGGDCEAPGYNILLGGWEWYVFYDLLLGLEREHLVNEVDWRVPITLIDRYMKDWGMGQFIPKLQVG